MPFPDEIDALRLVAHRDEWSRDFEAIAEAIRTMALADSGAIEHIGSTAVPDLIAKDVIDIQIRLPAIGDDAVTSAFERAGYRRRPEPWNNTETTRGGPVPKLVFAPGPGRRPTNIHVRTDGTIGARDALLFRDFLRADPVMRQSWGEFKQALVNAEPGIDLLEYGRVKQPAWEILMRAADAWAQETGWSPEPIGVWPTPGQR